MKTLIDFFDDLGRLLSDYAQDQVFPSIDLSLPRVLWDEAEYRLIMASAEITSEPDNPDPHGPWGKWHIAANILQEQLRDECMDVRGHGLLLGDWSHRALMDVARRRLS